MTIYRHFGARHQNCGTAPITYMGKSYTHAIDVLLDDYKHHAHVLLYDYASAHIHAST